MAAGQEEAAAAAATGPMAQEEEKTEETVDLEDFITLQTFEEDKVTERTTAGLTRLFAEAAQRGEIDGHMSQTKPSDCGFLTNLGKFYCFRGWEYKKDFKDFIGYVDFW